MSMSALSCWDIRDFEVQNRFPLNIKMSVTGCPYYKVGIGGLYLYDF